MFEAEANFDLKYMNFNLLKYLFRATFYLLFCSYKQFLKMDTYL